MTTKATGVQSTQVNPVILTGGKKEETKGATPKVIALPTGKPDKKAETKPQPTIFTAAAHKEEPKKRLSIDDINEKAERLNHLRVKYQTIREKRKQLDEFSISHDRNNAQLTLVDAEGMEITTSNPVSIGKLLKDWMYDLNNALEEVEEEMRKELAVFA